MSAPDNTPAAGPSTWSSDPQTAFQQMLNMAGLTEDHPDVKRLKREPPPTPNPIPPTPAPVAAPASMRRSIIFNDPAGDIEIISNDGVVLRVQSFYLLAAR